MPRAMRLLIYAMQSSGASTFCYFLGQRPGSIAVIDVWSRGVTPRIETSHPVVVKATVTMTRTAADHIANFRPDRTVLFVRDPVSVYASLRNYDYGQRFGTIVDKMMRLEHEFAFGKWDAVIRYEDFATRDPNVTAQIEALGWDCDPNYWELPRSRSTIQAFNMSESSWCKDHFENGWGFGNIKEGPISGRFSDRPDQPDITNLVASISPKLFSAYRQRRRRAEDQVRFAEDTVDDPDAVRSST
jgi:hypothetical protein